MGGTSAAAPQVAGVLALMKSVNPCLTATQAKDLLQITANKVGGYDYNYTATADGYAPGYSQELGHGKLNAYKAVLAAQASKSDGLDLYIKDNANDIGVVGINGTGGGDKSPDIWVRNSMDGLSYQLHENPEFSSGSCYVYVRVRNKSCVTSAGNEKLSLYWSKASSWSSWPANWNGSSPSTGNKIGASQNIPVLKPGESTILTFTWTLLNPYINNSWNSCLLARIEGVVADPITVYPSRLDKDFTENNNIATRNVTIVDNYPGIRGGRVLVGNVGDVARSFNVRAQVPANNSGGTMPNITAEAEVRMTFDTQGWSILQQSGTLNQQGIQVLPNNTLLLTSPNIVLSNLNFPANTRIPVDVSFYFLCDQQTANKRYEYEVSQAFTDTPNMILGRETYEINKTVRNPFNAYAGSDVTINKGASTTLSAQQIGEAASYKWYDNAHNFVDSGASICVSPTNNKDYTLEVISLVDGFKDYDAVSVNVRQHYINSISPNPATTNTNVSYDASNTSTASLQVLLANATVYANYTLNPTQTNYSMNTSSYPAGIYTIVLYCNGTAVDSKTLQIN
jgi:hypothetical protein